MNNKIAGMVVVNKLRRGLREEGLNPGDILFPLSFFVRQSGFVDVANRSELREAKGDSFDKKKAEEGRRALAVLKKKFGGRLQKVSPLVFDDFPGEVNGLRLKVKAGRK